MFTEFTDAAEDFSLCITAIEQVGTDCMKVESDAVPVFFMRTAYLQQVQPERIVEGSAFSGEEAHDVLQAALAFAAEKKAETYLARAEHSRFALERKLLQKGMDKQAIARALDYLEQKHYLSDERFAESWLRTHTKAQGRTRLLSELLARGVNRHIANAALDEFFADTTEEELCARAVEKSLRAGRTGDKLVRYLQQSGFSYRQIQAALKSTQPEQLPDDA